MRIFARLQEGWSYETIAREEHLTRERIRQIIAETLAARAVEPDRDHMRLQIARLDPALALAARHVAAGDLKAIDPLIRVLDRLDKYHGAVAGAAGGFDEAARDRLYAKIAHAARDRTPRLGAQAEPPPASPEASATAPAPDASRERQENDRQERDNEASKFFPRQLVENSRFGQG